MPKVHSGGGLLPRLAIPALFTGLLLVVPGTAQAQACSSEVSGVSGAGADFDGDGAVDLAIGDPNATVSGQARAGRVHIAYGDDTTQSISQSAITGNGNEAGDRFGFTMDTVDWNGDGCTDLFVGIPYENWENNTVPETGVVVFIPGSPSGLDLSLAKTWSQENFDGVTGVDVNEVGDRFGWDLAAGLDTAGEPYVVVGVPGEAWTGSDGRALDDGGNVFYARPGDAVDFNQNSVGYSDGFEAGDMFGYSVAASESGFVVGVPGESAEYGAETIHKVGTVFLIGHNDAASVPPQIAAWGQAHPEISDEYEDNDMYGFSVDMVDYISTGGGAAKMMIAVGAPGEAIGSEASAGLSTVLWSPGDGFHEYRNINQDTDGTTADSSEPGDAFGAEVAMVNRTPGQRTSDNTLLMASGVPGEDDEASGFSNIGDIQLFSMVENQNQEDNLVRDKLPTTDFAPTDGAALGKVLHATKDYLFVTATGATGPAVYRVPWDNIVADGTAGVKVYTPATFGLANADTASFGASLA